MESRGEQTRRAGRRVAGNGQKVKRRTCGIGKKGRPNGLQRDLSHQRNQHDPLSALAGAAIERGRTSRPSDQGRRSGLAVEMEVRTQKSEISCSHRIWRYFAFHPASDL